MQKVDVDGQQRINKCLINVIGYRLLLYLRQFVLEYQADIIFSEKFLKFFYLLYKLTTLLYILTGLQQNLYSLIPSQTYRFTTVQPHIIMISLPTKCIMDQVVDITLLTKLHFDFQLSVSFISRFLCLVNINTQDQYLILFSMMFIDSNNLMWTSWPVANEPVRLDDKIIHLITRIQMLSDANHSYQLPSTISPLYNTSAIQSYF